MIVTYQPIKAFHNTWAVLLMQPLQQSSSANNTSVPNLVQQQLLK
jgi:hypothetical protein